MYAHTEKKCRCELEFKNQVHKEEVPLLYLLDVAA